MYKFRSAVVDGNVAGTSKLGTILRGKSSIPRIQVAIDELRRLLGFSPTIAMRLEAGLTAIRALRRRNPFPLFPDFVSVVNIL